MSYELHLHFPSITDASKIVDLTRVIAVVNQTQTTVSQTQQEITDMSAELTRLTASVQKLTVADDAIITFLHGLSDQLLAAKDDPIAIAALADSIDSEAGKVSAAILANTPAPPPVNPAG